METGPFSQNVIAKGVSIDQKVYLDGTNPILG